MEQDTLPLITKMSNFDTFNGNSNDEQFYGNGNDEQFYGFGGNDTIDGGAGSDYIDGGEGHDTLTGNFGNDTLLGGAGNDTLMDDQGSNFLDGGDGNDNLTAQSLTGTHTLVGGMGEDMLTAVGTTLDLSGGQGSDQLSAVASMYNNGVLTYARNGMATLSGGSEEDHLHTAYMRSATLHGDEGSDWLNVAASTNALLFGDAGDDTLHADFTIYGDQVGNGLGIDYRLDGGEGNDVINATGTVYNTSGIVNLELSGGSGDDTLFVSDNGGSYKTGAVAYATLNGGDGNDLLTASGVLQLTLAGGTGNDTFALTAAEYQTLLIGHYDLWTQYATQSNNWDAASIRVNAKPVEITDFASGTGGDVLDLSDLLRNTAVGYDGSNPFGNGYLNLVQDGADTLLQYDPDGNADAASALMTIAVLNNVDASSFNSKNFLPNFGTPGNDYLVGTPGADVLNGYLGDDVLVGGEGNDKLTGDEGNDNLNGGAGDDVLYAGGGDDMADGGDGDDLIVGGYGAGDDTYEGGNGMDTVRYTSSTHGIVVNLSAGFANGTDIGSDKLFGIENVIGGVSDDLLIGNDSDNRLSGERGNDGLTGGAGYDTAMYAGRITDYSVTYRDGSFTVRDLNTADGDEGTDTMTGVEALHFSDRAVALTNPLRYIASNPDLIRAFGTDADAGIKHYFEYGLGEGRSATAFDPSWYLATNNDLRAAFGTNVDLAAKHYIEHGLREGRNADVNGNDLLTGSGQDDTLNGYGGNDVLMGGAGYDTAMYAGRITDYSVTYRDGGFTVRDLNTTDGDEGTDTMTGVEALHFSDRAVALTNPLRYIASNPDLIRAFGADGDAGIKHYFEYGLGEGRSATAFDPSWYLATNNDLRAVFGTDVDLAAKHYIEHGFREGRNADVNGNDLLTGSSQDDTLNGYGGNDILTGGTGFDTFIFSAPTGSGNIDTITDFDPTQDMILLEKGMSGMFDGLPWKESQLEDDAFAYMGGAVDEHTRVLYEPTTGALFYDADGSGVHSAMQFANVDGGLPLTYDNFMFGAV